MWRESGLGLVDLIQQRFPNLLFLKEDVPFCAIGQSVILPVEELSWRDQNNPKGSWASGLLWASLNPRVFLCVLLCYKNIDIEPVHYCEAPVG